jgi:hypothetical protein
MITEGILLRARFLSRLVPCGENEMHAFENLL